MLSGEYARVVLSLKNKISEWKLVRGGLALTPVEAGFDVLIVSMQPIGFLSERKWTFTAPVTLSEPVENLADTYRVLKAMECEVKVGGLLKRRYKFVESSVRRALFPTLAFDDRLARYLESSGEVMALLRKASPDELYVNTYYELEPGRSAIQCILESYRNPSKLGWLIVASKGPGVELLLPRVVRSMFELLDSMARHLREFTRELIAKGNSF